MCARRLALFVLVATAAPVEAQVVMTFQQGVGGYTGYHDSQLSNGNPNTVMTDFSPGNPGQIRVDPGDAAAFDAGYVYGLMRFDNIFGTGPGQIPPGSNINSATLRLNLTEDTGDGFLYLHRMITDWSDTTATWNFFSPTGVQLGTHAVATADASVGPGINANAPTPGSSTAYPIITADVTSSLQAWSNGFANRGWNIRPDNGTGANSATDGILFSSAEDPTAGNHPLLTVNFTTAVPEPGTLVLAGLGLIGVAAYRRRRH
jgi:PEP-CTERM motif